MTDLSYTVEITGVQDIERLGNTIDKLHGVLDAGRGSGKSLEELRKILLGFKGQASIFEELKNSVKGLDSTFKQGLGGLTTVIKQEMQALRGTVSSGAVGVGQAAAKGLDEGLAQAEVVASKRFKSISAKAKAEATAMYQAMVSGQANAKITEKGMGALFEFKEAGATLSPYHANLLKNWEASSKDTFRSIKQKLKQEAAEIKAAVKSETAALQAALGAMEAKSTLDRASVAGIFRSSLARGKFNVAQVKQQLKQEAAEIKAAVEGRNAEIQKSVSAAMNAPAGVYQKYNPNTGLAGSLVVPGGASKDLDKINAGLRRFVLDGNDAHSMARGLASGFNLLWLTWGNLAPLFVGAAISNGFMQTAKSGLQVADSLQTIASLGRETTDTLQDVQNNTAALSNTLMDLGNRSIHGPVELAEAMKVLSLAGLKANEVMTALGPTMNLALAGATDMKTAADVLVSITTAFEMGAGGFSEAADKIVIAAASSKASVESIGEAIKTASVVGEQFGASLTDVAALTASLANLGIQGSAAGTSIRNMFTDMSERTPKVSAAMKQLGIDFRDATTGDMKPLLENISQLDAALKNFSGRGAKDAIMAIFSERGAKAAIAALVDYRTQIADAQGRTLAWSEENNKLAKSLRDIENSAGAAAIKAAEMSQSTLNAFKSVGATMQTTMYKAFQEMEPALYLIAVRMREAFASPEAVSGLTSMVSSIARLGVALVENIGWITKVAGALLLYKTATMAAAIPAGLLRSASLGLVTLFPAIATGSGSAAVAVTAYATAANKAAVESAKLQAASAAGAAGMVGRLLGFIPVIGSVVSVAATGWLAYKTLIADSKEVGRDYLKEKNDNVIAALNAEADKLAWVNAERAKGLSLMEAEERYRLKEATDKQVGSFSDALRQETDSLRKAEGDLAFALSRRIGSPGQLLYDNMDVGVKKAEKEVAARKREIQRLQSQQDSFLLDQQVAANRVAAEQQTQRDITAREAKGLQDKLNQLYSTSSKGFDKGGRGGFGVGGFDQINLDKDNELKRLQASLDAEMGVRTDAYNREKKLMDARRDGELMSQEQYIIASSAMATKYEQDQLEILERGTSAYLTAYIARQEALKAELAKAKTEQGKSKVREALEREENDMLAEMTKRSAQIATIRAESAERIELSYIKLESEVGKLTKADKEFWEARYRNNLRESEAEALERSYDNINKSVFSMDEGMLAYVKAQQKSRQETEEHLTKLRQQLAVQKTLLELKLKEVEDAAKNPAIPDSALSSLQGEADRVRASIKTIEKTISDSTKKGLEEGLSEGAKAMDKVAYQKFLGLRDSLSDIVMEGITGDAKSAGKRLRDLLQKELLVEPLTVHVRAFVGSILGSIGLGASGQGGAAGGVGGLSSIMSLGSNLKTAYDLYSGGGMAGMLLGNSVAYGAAVPGLTVGSTQAAMLAAQTGAFGGAGLSATASAGATASGAGAAAGATASGAGAAAGGLSATGIGAIVAAAVVAAGNLYKAGYTEDALTGVGKPGKLAYLLPGYRLAEHTNSVLKKLGVSEQWANMLSGTTAMAALFGRKLKDSGIEGSFGGEAGFTGQRFEYYKGGLFRSNKTVHSELDAETQSMLATAFKSVQTGVKDMAQQLGLGGEALNGFSHQVKFSLKGLTQEESAALLQEELGKLGNAMAALLPDVSKYTQGNETTLQTLERLSGALQSANQAFDNLGYSLYDASLAGADMADKLANLFGGLEQMGQQVGSFMQNFYSEAEQRKAVQAQLQKAFEGLDLKLPDINAADARQQYRKLAESLDLTSEEGRKAWVQVLQLSDAFAGVTEPLQSAAQAAQAMNSAAEEAARAAEDARRAWQDITDRLLDERSSADIALLRAMGKEEEALAQERLKAIKGFDAYQVSLYDGTQAILKQVEALKAQAEAAEQARQAALELAQTLTSELPAVLDKYRTPEQRTQAQYDQIAANLSAAGINVSAQALMGASKDQIAQAAMAIYNLGSTSDETRLAILRAASGLADLKDAAVTAALQTYQSATDDAWAQLQREADLRRGVLQETIDDVRAVFDAVRDAARSLYDEVDSSRTMLAEQGRAFIDNALANARASGYLPDAGELKQALEASTSGLAQQVYASQFEADRDRLVLAGKLRELEDISGEQLSEAQRQLKTLDDTLANARAQLDALRGIDASVQGVQARLEQLAAAMAAEQQAKNAARGGGGGGGGNNRPGGQNLPGWGHWGNAGDWVVNSSGSVVADAKTGMVYAQDGSTSSRGALVQAATDMLNAGQDRALYDAIAAGGFTLGQANQVLGLPEGSAEDWAKSLGLPVYHQGTPLVPATGLALLQQGEAVIPRALNPFAAGAATGEEDAALVAELRALRAEVAALRATAERTATATARQARQFDRVSAGGDALAVLLVNHTLRAEVAA